jgi:hypothetical protein
MKQQKDLPGMEDRKLADLVDSAEEYAKIRDKRQDLTKREVELKSDLLALMHKYKKKEYVFDGIEIRVVLEEETVKVKVTKPDAEDEKDSQS